MAPRKTTGRYNRRVQTGIFERECFLLIFVIALLLAIALPIYQALVRHKVPWWKAVLVSTGISMTCIIGLYLLVTLIGTLLDFVEKWFERRRSQDDNSRK